MTTLADEASEQKRWNGHACGRPDVAFALVANEFDTPEGHRERIALPLSRVLRIAAAHVPRYRNLFRKRGIDPALQDPFDVLSRLPVMDAQDLSERTDRLIAEAAPEARDRLVHEAVLSRSAVKVAHSLASVRMADVLTQREYRWARFDPAAAIASIRPPAQLPRHGDGRLLEGSQVMRQKSWPHLRGLYETGVHYAFCAANPAAQQHDFLARLAPRHVIASPDVAATLGEQPLPRGVTSLLAISGLDENATVVSAAFHQAWHLEPFGPVAMRCEAGRFHVHSENCHVEVLDEADKPVAIGDTGRIVVTTLCNTAMPLLRYDSAYTASVCDPACPCGRTMPAFVLH